MALYAVYLQIEADLVEVNPLVLTEDARVVALDAKVSLDPGALARQPAELMRSLESGQAEEASALEDEGAQLGLQFIELDGSVGVLANGAGLTMATLDAVNHYGGRPANFLEIGGDAYTKATPALALVLKNPNVRSLLVNFCGAFARTDVMTEGVVNAIEKPPPGGPGVLLHPRHRRGRSHRLGSRPAGIGALRPDGRRGAGRGGGCRARERSSQPRERTDDRHRKRNRRRSGDHR